MTDFDIDNTEKTPLNKNMLRSQENEITDSQKMQTSMMGGLVDFEDGSNKVSKFKIRSIVGLLAYNLLVKDKVMLPLLIFNMIITMMMS